MRRRAVAITITVMVLGLLEACGLEVIGRDPELRDTGDGGAPTAVEGGGNGPSVDDGSVGDANANDAGMDGSVVDAAGRVPGAIALYLFDEGSGVVVRDRSTIAPALDLTIADGGAETEWTSTRTLAIKGNALLESQTPATKIIEACVRTGEFTIEAWVAPSATNPSGVSRITGISATPNLLDATLSANSDTYLFRVRTSTRPEVDNDMITPPSGASPALTHLVYTRRANGKRVGYVDGVVRVEDGNATGDLTKWDRGYRLVVANEATRDRPWQGELHLVAYYDRALEAPEVLRNFKAPR